MLATLDDFPARKEALRAAILPRPQARDYTIRHAHGATTPAPWGQAMACAMLSLRNGAQVTSHGGGVVTLTSGTQHATWIPATLLPTANEPTTGRDFLHARHITTTGTRTPERCTITRLTADRVYYRTATGAKCHADRAEFTRSVLCYL